MADEGKILSLADIATLDDTNYLVVPVEEWKGAVRLGSLDGAALLDWVEKNEGPEANTSGLRLLCISLVDAEGKRIGDADTVAMMKRKNSKVVVRLINEALHLNGLKAKEEEGRKNGSSEASSVASPTA